MTDETITIQKDTLYGGIIVFLAGLLVLSILTQGFGIIKPQTIVNNVVPTANTNPAPSPTPSPNPTPTTTAKQITIPSYVPAKGSSSAAVNIIEFGDYQCPYCSLWYKQVESSLTNDYINSGKAKLYFLDFAFLGPDSQTLAQGTWCANEQGKYYDYYQYVYSNQGQEGSGWGTVDKIKAFVGNIPGLNVANFNSCLDSGKYVSRVQELTQFGQSAGVRGTPTVFIGNAQKGYTQVSGYDYRTFKQAIDSLLAN